MSDPSAARRALPVVQPTFIEARIDANRGKAGGGRVHILTGAICNEDGSLRALDDLGRDAPREQPLEPAAGAGTDDDQVALARLASRRMASVAVGSARTTASASTGSRADTRTSRALRRR